MARGRSSQIVPGSYEATIHPDHGDYVVGMLAKLTPPSPACLLYSDKGMDVPSTLAQFDLPDA